MQLLRDALRAIQQGGRGHTAISSYASLYETAPVHLTDQPRFLNTAVRVTTSLPPHELLAFLQGIEMDLGRRRGPKAVRFGPRPIDLDIIFYGVERIATDALEVPHPRWRERDFVIAPACELLDPRQADGGAHANLEEAERLWMQRLASGVDADAIRRVMPLGSGLVDFADRPPLVMGILNATPDSFSDGGLYGGARAALEHAKRMAGEGAAIIDVGGQSTRPGATRLSTAEERARVLPVLEALAPLKDSHDFAISIDTFDARVAEAAVSAGADIVNDVSAGALDPAMHATVAALDVPYVMTHARGCPKTMQESRHTRYDSLMRDVASELEARCVRASLPMAGPHQIASSRPSY